MNFAARYFLWVVALFFAILPIALPIARSPDGWARVFEVGSYRESVSDLLLLCITICVISMIDIMETFALTTKENHKPKRLPTTLAVVLLGLVVLMMFCYCFWYAHFKVNSAQMLSADVLASMPLYIISCLILSMACRTVYLIAES